MEAFMNQAGIEQGIPPSFNGSQFGYFFALFGLMTMCLLAANWLWRIWWCVIEDPHPLRTPVTVSRIVIALMLMASLLRGLPDAILLIRWPELSPGARLAIAETDRYLDGLALFPFGLAWLIDYLVANVVQFQLKRLPPPAPDIWPRIESLKQPAKIAAGSFAIAFAVVFLQ